MTATGWKVVIERSEASSYRLRMGKSFQRLFILAVIGWLISWGYVGWRGHEMTAEAHRFIEMIPPGARIPDFALAALEAGQSYTLRAAICGAGVPLVIFLTGWVLKPYIRDRRIVRF